MTDDPGRLPQIDAPPMPIAAYAGVGVVVLVLLLFAFGVFGGIPDTTRGQLLRAGAVLLAAGVLLAAYFAWRSQLPYRLPGTAEDGISYAIARLSERRSIVGSAWIWLLLPLVPGIAVLYAGAANVRGVGLAWWGCSSSCSPLPLSWSRRDAPQRPSTRRSWSSKSSARRRCRTARRCRR
jgi:hypothetical protein